MSSVENMIAHIGPDCTTFVRVVPSGPEYHQQNWNLVHIPDDKCFLTDEFAEGFLGYDGTDPRYILVKMVPVISFP